jgi:signal transduction histidine kinase
MDFAMNPIRDQAARVAAFDSIDITERKRRRRDRALLAEEARQMAEQATRAKDEFLAVVSHELRSPLNAILGWNRLLRSRRGDDPQIARVTETVESSGRAQLRLIEDLLDTARITGKMKLEPNLSNPWRSSVALDTASAADGKGHYHGLDPKWTDHRRS